MGSTENAVLLNSDLCANVTMVGSVTTARTSIFVLVHPVDNMVYVKIILLTLLACAKMVIVDICAKSLIIV